MSDISAQQTELYFFLARIFAREVDAGLLKQLRSPEVQAILKELDIELDSDLLNLEEAEILENLAIEYTGCFVGPGEFVSPQESIHHERDDSDWGKYWGADTAAVKKFIESAGMEIKDPFAGLPDHISVELDFVGYMGNAINEKLTAGAESEALYGLRMKRKFFDDHLLQWVDKFCDKTIEISELPLYREMAGLLKAVVALDSDALNEDIAQLETKLEVKTEG